MMSRVPSSTSGLSQWVEERECRKCRVFRSVLRSRVVVADGGTVSMGDRGPDGGLHGVPLRLWV